MEPVSVSKLVTRCVDVREPFVMEVPKEVLENPALHASLRKANANVALFEKRVRTKVALFREFSRHFRFYAELNVNWQALNDRLFNIDFSNCTGGVFTIMPHIKSLGWEIVTHILGIYFHVGGFHQSEGIPFKLLLPPLADRK
jgi:hypothetical protein